MIETNGSTIVFQSGFQASVNKISRELKKEQNSLYNCVNSILHDAAFVEEISLLYPNIPVFANLRCGLWYVRNADKTCYFKSTDGHYGNWSFSVSRLNMHIVEAATSYGGVIIVDGTRRGKRFPDAFTKTIPIWCAVVNRAVARLRAQAPDRQPSLQDWLVDPVSHPGQGGFGSGSSDNAGARPQLGLEYGPAVSSKYDWDLDLHLPPWISRNERNQIEARLDGWVEALLTTATDFPRVAKMLRKPLRPLWLSPASRVWTDAVAQPKDLAFAPVILLSASQPLSYERKVTGSLQRGPAAASDDDEGAQADHEDGEDHDRDGRGGEGSGEATHGRQPRGRLWTGFSASSASSSSAVPAAAASNDRQPSTREDTGRGREGGGTRRLRKGAAPKPAAADAAAEALGCSWTYVYVPGAGDDEESWARGLTPEMLWRHREALVSAGPAGILSVVQRLLTAPAASRNYPSHLSPSLSQPSPAAASTSAAAITPLTDEHHLRPKGCEMAEREPSKVICRAGAFFIGNTGIAIASSRDVDLSQIWIHVDAVLDLSVDPDASFLVHVESSPGCMDIDQRPQGNGVNSAPPVDSSPPLSSPSLLSCHGSTPGSPAFAGPFPALSVVEQSHCNHNHAIANVPGLTSPVDNRLSPFRNAAPEQNDGSLSLWLSSAAATQQQRNSDPTASATSEHWTSCSGDMSDAPGRTSCVASSSHASHASLPAPFAGLGSTPRRGLAVPGEDDNLGDEFNFDLTAALVGGASSVAERRRSTRSLSCDAFVSSPHSPAPPPPPASPSCAVASTQPLALGVPAEDSCLNGGQALASSKGSLSDPDPDTDSSSCATCPERSSATSPGCLSSSSPSPPLSLSAVPCVPVLPFPEYHGGSCGETATPASCSSPYPSSRVSSALSAASVHGVPGGVGSERPGLSPLAPAVMRLPVRSSKQCRDGMLQSLAAALGFCRSQLVAQRRLLLVDEAGLDTSVCVAVALLLSSFESGTETTVSEGRTNGSESSPTYRLQGAGALGAIESLPRVEKADIRRHLAFVSSYYPQARPTRGMLRQVFNYFVKVESQDVLA